MLLAQGAFVWLSLPPPPTSFSLLPPHVVPPLFLSAPWLSRFFFVVGLRCGAQSSNWEGADFTNAVVDRVSFDGSSMKVRERKDNDHKWSRAYQLSAGSQGVMGYSMAEW